MRTIIKIWVCVFVVLLCTSCVTAMIISSEQKRTNNLDRKIVLLNGRTAQRINRHSALMITSRNDVVCVISTFSDYYDGMTIKGRFRRCGTYEYRFSDGAIHYAPIFVRVKDYKKFAIIAEELSDTSVLSESKNGTEYGIGI